MDITEQGTRHLAVVLGESSQGTSLTRILGLRTSPGWIVDGNAVREWRFEGVTEQKGTIYMYGPFVAGPFLTDILGLPCEKALPFIARLTEALLRLSEASIPWFPLQSDAVQFPESGGVLFLPPAIYQELRDLRTFEVNRDSFESLNHPDLKGERLASFTIAAAMYRVATGRFAFSGSAAEELHEQARKLAIMPPSRLVPELKPEVSALIMAGLGRERGSSVDLATWRASLAAWRDQPLFHALGEEEKQKALQEAASQEQVAAKSFRRRMFWEKNWKLVAIIAAVVIAGAAVAGSFIKNALAPRVTRGDTPEQVVRAFYEGMNTIDHMTMEACVVNKAGQGYINEATTLYVTSRVTMGYEGSSNIVSAEEWDKAGRPTLVSPQTLFGVTGLSLTQEKAEPTPVFLVTCDIWNPAQSSDASLTADAIPQSEGTSIVERVSLRKDKGDWVIYQIDRLKESPLPTPKAEAKKAGTDANAAPLSGAQP